MQDGCKRDHSQANPLPFTVTGEVIRGKQLGSKLGFPTANIRHDMRRNAWPAEGVYAGVACVRDALYLCVLNQGKHPTLPEGEPTIEAFILDFSGDVYGADVTVEYVEFIRGEVRFPDIEALKTQIARDVETARNILE